MDNQDTFQEPDSERKKRVAEGLRAQMEDKWKSANLDPNDAILMAFGAGFSMGESGKFKTAHEAWDAFEKKAREKASRSRNIP